MELKKIKVQIEKSGSIRELVPGMIVVAKDDLDGWFDEGDISEENAFQKSINKYSDTVKKGESLLVVSIHVFCLRTGTQNKYLSIVYLTQEGKMISDVDIYLEEPRGSDEFINDYFWQNFKIVEEKKKATTKQ